MNFIKSPYLFGALVVCYFAVTWFFPWDIFQIDSTVSVSYAWDLLFAAIVAILYGLPLRIGSFSGALPRTIAMLSLAGLSLLFLQMTAYPAPFRYLERPILQLLVLAPILEELVFRYGILGASLKVTPSKNKAMLLGAFLFALSHLPGIWHLPPEFSPFIVIQVAYTFAMGWVLGKSRVRTGGVVEPILLHFLFNLCFYFAILKEWI